MDVLRNRTQGFTIINNIITRDPNMKLKDRGMYAVLKSLPDGWQLSVAGMVAILKEGKEAVSASLRSLEKAGYLERHKLQARGRMMGTEWNIVVQKNSYVPQCQCQKVEENTIILRNHTQGYTVVSNTILKNKELSLKDKGMMIMLMSFPDGWRLSTLGLMKLVPDGKGAICTCLKNLENMGYLIRNRARDERGKFTYSTWEVYDTPQVNDTPPQNPDEMIKQSSSGIENEEEINEKKGNDDLKEKLEFVENSRIYPEQEKLQTESPNTKKFKTVYDTS